MDKTASALQGVQIKESKFQELIHRIQEWALLQGVQMKPADDSMSTNTVQYAPMTLFPSLMPAKVLQEAKSLQTHYNRLMHRVAYDHEFLEQSLKNVIKVDSFTRMLWSIYTKVKEEGLVQPVSLGLFRNDYMLDVKDSDTENDSLSHTPSLKQIEFNTIASSFGGLVTGMWQVHRYSMTLAGVQFKDEQIPKTSPAADLARGLFNAWKIYNQPSAVIVFVVQEVERNRMDQKWLEKCLFELDRNVKVVYASLEYASSHGSLREDKTYAIDDQEVAVIYFRAGYIPDHYPSEKESRARLDMERSKVIKCPSVHYQLAGCKKIQQALSAPGSLERFIDDTSILERIRSTFAGQYTLDKGPEGDTAIAMATKSPHKFVLKPQREGGGNNLYGEDIKHHLNAIKDTDKRNAYILMERIFPWPQRNHLLKVGEDPRLRKVISELGIYGVYIGSSEAELMNEEAGHVLRTKDTDDNEGGIVAGFATIDTPFLVE